MISLHFYWKNQIKRIVEQQRVIKNASKRFDLTLQFYIHLSVHKAITEEV